MLVLTVVDTQPVVVVAALLGKSVMRVRKTEIERERERGQRLRVRKVKKTNRKKKKIPFDSISRVRVVRIGDLILGKIGF